MSLPNELIALREHIPAEYLRQSRECVAEWLRPYDAQHSNTFLDGFKTAIEGLDQAGQDTSPYAPILVALVEEVERKGGLA